MNIADKKLENTPAHALQQMSQDNLSYRYISVSLNPDNCVEDDGFLYLSGCVREDRTV